MLTKEQAIRKFKAFENGALMKACGKCCNEAMKAQARAQFTKAQLLEFWAETKNLTFPEWYGQTPWECAGTVAYEVAKEAEAEAERERKAMALHTHLALRARKAKKPVQLGLFEPQQLMLI